MKDPKLSLNTLWRVRMIWRVRCYKWMWLTCGTPARTSNEFLCGLLCACEYSPCENNACGLYAQHSHLQWCISPWDMARSVPQRTSRRVFVVRKPPQIGCHGARTKGRSSKSAKRRQEGQEKVAWLKSSPVLQWRIIYLYSKWMTLLLLLVKTCWAVRVVQSYVISRLIICGNTFCSVCELRIQDQRSAAAIIRGPNSTNKSKSHRRGDALVKSFDAQRSKQAVMRAKSIHDEAAGKT